MTTAKTCPECASAWIAMDLDMSQDGRRLECSNPECDYTEDLPTDSMMRLLSAPTLPGFGDA